MDALARHVVVPATRHVMDLLHLQDVLAARQAVQVVAPVRVVAAVQIRVVQVALVVVLVHVEVAVLLVAQALVDMDVVQVALPPALADATKVVHLHVLENVAAHLVVEYVQTYVIVVSVTGVVKDLVNPHVKEHAFTLAI